MLNWLKSGKLSEGTSEAITNNRGEGQRESEESEVITGRCVGDRPGEELGRESERNETEETEKEEGIAKTNLEHIGQSRSQGEKRGNESEHQTGKKKRKYDENYLGLGFTWIGNADCPKPQCVVCSEVLANSCLKPSYLRRHLNTKHASVSQKPLTFFFAKLEELQNSQKQLQSHSCVGSTKNALRASYLLSYRIARKGLPHTIAEDVCLPAAKEMVECMIGEREAKKLDMIPVSNNTVAPHRCFV